MSAIKQARVLLTRPAEQSKNLADLLKDRGAIPTICPVIEIVRLLSDDDISSAWLQWRTTIETGLVALTSARTAELLMTAAISVDQPCAPVGPRTRQAVQEAGWQLVQIDAKDGASLAAELIDAGYAGSDVWLPCSKKAATDLEESLRATGSRVTRVDLYEPRPITGQLLHLSRERAFDVIVFHSPSSVDSVVDAIGIEALVDVQVVCVGQSTGSRADQRGLRVASTAQQPTDLAVLDAIASTVALQSSIIGAT